MFEKNQCIYLIDLILKCQLSYVAFRQFRVIEQCSPCLQTGGGGSGKGGLVVIPLTKSLYKYNIVAY